MVRGAKSLAKYFRTVDRMKTWLIEFESSTDTIKAQRILSKNKFKVTTEKINKGSRGGCTSGLRVTQSPELLCKILAKNGVFCKSVKGG
ncbi:MAG: hypothetical protein ACI4JX_07190 [Oscillospiraceae bacterium]